MESDKKMIAPMMITYGVNGLWRFLSMTFSVSQQSGNKHLTNVVGGSIISISNRCAGGNGRVAIGYY